MTSSPTGPISQSPSDPKPPISSSSSKSLKGEKPEDLRLLQSPFAKMFRGTGAEPTAAEMRAIINGILQEQINQIKRQEAKVIRAMRNLRKVIQGDE